MRLRQLGRFNIYEGRGNGKTGNTVPACMHTLYKGGQLRLPGRPVPNPRPRKERPPAQDHRPSPPAMHWLLQLLVDLVLVLIVIAAYRFYQQKRRREVEYARVQLYEDADKPCACSPPQP